MPSHILDLNRICWALAFVSFSFAFYIFCFWLRVLNYKLTVN